MRIAKQIYAWRIGQSMLGTTGIFEKLGLVKFKVL